MKNVATITDLLLAGAMKNNSALDLVYFIELSKSTSLRESDS
jgi:hypothetical protein